MTFTVFKTSNYYIDREKNRGYDVKPFRDELRKLNSERALVRNPLIFKSSIEDKNQIKSEKMKIKKRKKKYGNNS